MQKQIVISFAFSFFIPFWLLSQINYQTAKKEPFRVNVYAKGRATISWDKKISTDKLNLTCQCDDIGTKKIHVALDADNIKACKVIHTNGSQGVCCYILTTVSSTKIINHGKICHSMTPTRANVAPRPTIDFEGNNLAASWGAIDGAIEYRVQLAQLPKNAELPLDSDFFIPQYGFTEGYVFEDTIVTNPFFNHTLQLSYINNLYIAIQVRLSNETTEFSVYKVEKTALLFAAEPEVEPEISIKASFLPTKGDKTIEYTIENIGTEDIDILTAAAYLSNIDTFSAEQVGNIDKRKTESFTKFKPNMPARKRIPIERDDYNYLHIVIYHKDKIIKVKTVNLR